MQRARPAFAAQPHDAIRTWTWARPGDKHAGAAYEYIRAPNEYVSAPYKYVSAPYKHASPAYEYAGATDGLSFGHAGAGVATPPRRPGVSFR